MNNELQNPMTNSKNKFHTKMAFIFALGYFALYIYLLAVTLIFHIPLAYKGGGFFHLAGQFFY